MGKLVWDLENDDFHKHYGSISCHKLGITSEGEKVLVPSNEAFMVPRSEAAKYVEVFIESIKFARGEIKATPYMDTIRKMDDEDESDNNTIPFPGQPD